MKPFKRHVAIAIDGGGLRGVMATRALEVVERALGKNLAEVARLAAGTSTGAIIASGLALGLTAAELTRLYLDCGPELFVKTWRTRVWPFVPYRYSSAPLKTWLDRQTQGKRMGDLWVGKRKFDLVVVTHDLLQARSLFIKPWKPEYAAMPITTAVMASAAAPTYFPVVEGRYVDGTMGSFGDPAFIAAYEARYCLGWRMEDTTLLSLGTGRSANTGLALNAANRYIALQWITPLLNTFLDDANDQQARLVAELFTGMDFRRFQMTTGAIELDDASKLTELLEYGELLGQMILNDQTDPALKEPVYKIA